MALIGVSLPNFWLGIMLIYFLGGQWNLLPVAGRIEYGIEVKSITRLYLVDSLITGNFAAFWSVFKHLLMPAVTLGTALAAIVTRITRSSVLEVMRQDYVMTARAKGLSERAVIWHHILRNALITVITVLGLQLGALLNGAVITETVFSYPGIGDLLIQSISVRDYRLTQVLILFFGVIYFLVNLLVDVLYTLVVIRAGAAVHHDHGRDASLTCGRQEQVSDQHRPLVCAREGDALGCLRARLLRGEQREREHQQRNGL